MLSNIIECLPLRLDMSKTENAASIIRKSFSKKFTKHNTDTEFNVAGIYPLHENVFDEDEIPVLLYQ